MLFNFKNDPKKSGKREVASMGLALWFIITSRLFLFTNPEFIDAFASIYNGLTIAILPTCIGMFGWDSYLKRRDTEDSVEMYGD